MSKCFKINHDSINKNHNNSHNNFSYDYCSTNKFTVLHQNVRGITNKLDEFLISLPPNAPQVICLREHHLQTEEIGNVNFRQYTLGSAFCRQTFNQGGVCIYISKNICFNAINLDQYIKEKDLEICALKLCLLTSCFTVICIYRSPTGDFTYFLNHLESLLNKTCKTSTDIILCGDFNINYLDDNSRKHTLDSLLASFGLFSTVKFPTRISSQSCTLIDNIFINIYNHDFSVHPFINGLSDHDGQIITFSNIANSVPGQIYTITREINSHTIMNFTLLLSYENWEDVFLEKDVNILFNNFLNTYLRIFYASFPNIKTKNAYNPKPWLTTGIRISCATKRELYLTYRKSNNPIHKEYYKTYCQILSKVIMSAKKLYYNNLIMKSNNKPKTTWNIELSPIIRIPLITLQL